MPWTQVYDPFGHWWLSTLVATLPILVLFGLLVGLKIKPHWCAIGGATTAAVVAVMFFKMPVVLAVASFGYGVAFGLLKIAWIVLAAVFLYDISVETGQFEIMKESVAGITADRRLQVLLVAFCFGAFIEGAAGFGAPVAIAGALMIGLGFRPFHAAALNLIANTAPVAWGSIGIPIHTLAAACGLPESDLSATIGRILPFTAAIVPFWLVRTMVSWSETFEVFPAILVVGVSFALTQFFWSNYVDSSLVDIMGGVVSILAAIVFLRFWKPKKIWRFDYDDRKNLPASPTGEVADSFGGEWTAEDFDKNVEVRAYPLGTVLRAWMPFGILSAVVLVWGLPPVKLALNRATTPAFKVVLADGTVRPGPPGWDVPYLHNAVYRAAPVVAKPAPEAARYDLNWLSATGTGCFLAADYFRTAAGFVSPPDGKSFLAHAGAHASGGDCDFFYAGAGIRHPLLRAGRRAGPGVYPHRLGLSVFRHVPGLARSSVDRERYVVQCAIRKFAADYFTATRNRSGADVRRQQRWRRDGQNGGCAIHHNSDFCDEPGRK